MEREVKQFLMIVFIGGLMLSPKLFLVLIGYLIYGVFY